MGNNMVIRTAASPPPPPPQAPAAPTAPAKSSRKMLYAIIAVVIIVVAVVAVVFLLMGGSSPSGGSNNNTGGNTNTQGSSGNVETASSMKFSTSYTSSSGQEASFAYTFYAKNIGTQNMMIRIEGNLGGQDVTYIVNGAQQKAWVFTGDYWTDLSDNFSEYWSTWDDTWKDYRANLIDWVGSGDVTYSNPGGGSVRVYDISVNPSLSDSLFQR